MTTIIAIQSCNSCLNQSHKYIASCVVAMYDYNNIHVVIPVIHLLPSCYSYARPGSIMLQNLPDMLFACIFLGMDYADISYF